MGASVSSRACGVRRLVQQQRQGVHQLVHAHRQRRHGRLDGGGLGIRLGHVQLGRHAFALPQPREREIAIGVVQRLAQHRQLVLGAAQPDVVAGGFREHRQHDAALRFQRGLRQRAGLFDLAPHAAPQVQFPAGIDAGLPQVERGLAAASGRIGQAGSLFWPRR